MDFINFQLPKHVHVIGICGVATSALAIAFHEAGIKVTGSDKGFFPPISTELEKHKVPFYAGWHPERMFGDQNKIDGKIDPKSDVVIIGTASGTQNPETARAKELGLKCYSFAEAIGAFFAKERAVVCVGTWGKTSSSALLSFILEKVGMDPSYMFGGVSLSHESSARIGNSKWSIFEGDEYKSSPTDPTAKFFYYKPTDLLLTGVSWDHADLYPTENSYFDTFKKLVASLPTSGMIVANVDNKGVLRVLGSPAFTQIKTDIKAKIITYGTKNAEYTYNDVRQSKDGLTFTIGHDGKEFAIKSSLLGAFQAENITGCFAMAHSLGVGGDKIVRAIADFKGLKRRLEKRLDGDISKNGVTIIDDIAHSPEKAISVLKNLREIYEGKVIAIFEPNSGGRERGAIPKYDNAFKNADIVIIPRLTALKIGNDDKETPMEGDELAEVIGNTHTNVQYEKDDKNLVNFLVLNAKKGDVIAFLGSHGFRGMIEETIKELG